MAELMRVQNDCRQQLQGPARFQQPPETHERAWFFDGGAAQRSSSASGTAVLQQ